MERRNFLSSIGLGSIALGTAPALTAFNTPSHNPKEGTLLFDDDYTLADRARSGIALGGIGTGSLELRPDGNFYNWTVFNNIPHAYGPVFEVKNAPLGGGWEDSLLFFVIRYQEEKGEPKLRILNLTDSFNIGGMDKYGAPYMFPWLKPVKNIRYSGKFPFITMHFSDPEMPFEIEMEAFSPFIPHDAKNSALPGIYFNFDIKHTGHKPVDVNIIASQRNLVGYDTNDKYFISEVTTNKDYVFVNQTAGGMDNRYPTYGNMGMASLSPDSTWYMGWSYHHPYYEQVLRQKKLPNINDTDGVDSIEGEIPAWMPKTNGRNTIDPDTGEKVGYADGFGEQKCLSSIACNKKLEVGQSMKHTFVMTWNFPNNYAEKDVDKMIRQGLTDLPKNMGKYYNNYFKDALEVADYLSKNRNSLTKRSKQFLNDYFASDLEKTVLNQVNSHLNTFVTSGWLNKDGFFGVREGVSPHRSYAAMYTIDVALYGSAMICNLFPELQKQAMRQHKKAQAKRGEINHGLPSNLDKPKEYDPGSYNRVDMPGNYVQMVMRDYFWSNDKEFLKEMWPSVKKAINYILEYRDANHDKMPDVIGLHPECSYDNFPMKGLSAYIQSQWLAAMAGAAEAAHVLDDDKAEKQYSAILKNGKKLMEDKLWNGEYYRISNDYMGDAGINEGCLTDQMIGQWMLHQTGSGYILDKERIKIAMQSIYKINYKKGYWLKNYGEKEQFILDVEPDSWIDQENTPWTGVELAFASFLLYEGFYREALDVIKCVDRRYREAGFYWNHIECGGHYFRPMSSWAIINAALGLQVNQGKYSFSPKIPDKKFKLFFSFAGGTAHFVENGDSIEIRVLTGEMKLTSMEFENSRFPEGASVKMNNEIVQTNAREVDEKMRLDFGKEVTVKQGNYLIIN